jgi:catechol 2,3-dioxygenase-like lactoylglutathione lyase family enzyme
MNLNQVTIGSTDLLRSQQFYAALGLRLIVRDEHYLRFECPEGGSTFSVELVEGSAAAEAVTIYFETDRIDAEYARLAAAGVVFDQEPADMPWLWREVRLRDPDGHLLCLYHAGVNRKNPPWRIGAPG